MKKILFIVLFSIFFSISIFFLTAILHEYRPEPVKNLQIDGKAKVEKVDVELKFLTWNLGYGGLGKDADFFMDGGVSSKPKNIDIVNRNLKGILEALSSAETDVYLLQEVDVASKRSFKINQYELLKSNLLDFELYFACNFGVYFVPVPFLDPLGKAHSGVVTGSRFKTDEAVRISLPSIDSWPEKLFHLKRCMLVSRYRKIDGKELVVINIHLSAYDDGEIRNEQMKKIKNLAVSEYEKGNSVIIGGDWNQRFPGIKKNQFGVYTTDEKYLSWAQKIDDNWTPKGWKWVFDQKIPTVRNNESAYESGKNFTTVIDGFLVSPGVEVISVETFDLGFEFSDHNPVVMKVKLFEIPH